jgi:phage baseplate assembly protein W
VSNDFLGTGWQFQVGLDERGRVAMAEHEASIRQSIWLILGTAPGERLMRPDFGCGIHDFVFAVNSAGTAGQIAHLVRMALLRWEPRIDVLGVAAEPDRANPTLMLIEIAYQVRLTNSRYNLVYPFYLE